MLGSNDCRFVKGWTRSCSKLQSIDGATRTAVDPRRRLEILSRPRDIRIRPGSNAADKRATEERRTRGVWASDSGSNACPPVSSVPSACSPRGLALPSKTDPRRGPMCCKTFPIDDIRRREMMGSLSSCGLTLSSAINECEGAKPAVPRLGV
eukprot:scaffold99129_cov31-Tisochrysis_lutea.AAC.2